MRRRTFTRTLISAQVTAAFIIVALGALPLTAQAAPCTGAKRLQLRWSSKTGTALVSLSATLCDRPPSCSDVGARTAGTMFTKSPITVTIKDATGRTISTVVDAGAADCTGRCERSNRGGCLGGADTHRLAGSFIRYVVNTQGQTTVVANKLRILTEDPSNFVTPFTVTVTDADGYAVTAELHKCRTRRSAGSAAVTCS
jgi:hypothetical protein